MDKIDKLILKSLRKSKKTAYQLSKELKISWQTIRIRLYRLLSEGKIEKIEEERGALKKIYWVLKDEKKR